MKNLGRLLMGIVCAFCATYACALPVASREVPRATSTNTTQRAVATGRTQNSARASAHETGRGATERTVTSRNNAKVSASRTTASERPATSKSQPRVTNATRTASNRATVARSTQATNEIRRSTNNDVKSRAARTNVTAQTTRNAGTRARNTISSLTDLAPLTETCKSQYIACMDNYCNILNDDLGRCSCSKNIKNYAKTEQALEQAKEALQDVAQQISYIGLSADEIDTLFSQTEAESMMQSINDNSQLNNDLDKIKNMIVDIKSGSVSAAVDSGLSFDLSGLLNLDFSSNSFDPLGLFSGGSNTSSVSNQRGEQLYNTAAARCRKSVLDKCQAQGVSIALITNSYDMEIDKQCIAYEKNLRQQNDEIQRTIRNAQNVLQKARLTVASEKNSYDLRGCINALDSCVQDDNVCGTDYEYCLDPTGKYIVNGEVVIGSTPGFNEDELAQAPTSFYSKNTLYGAWYYDNGKKYAWADTVTDGTLGEYIKATVAQTPVKNSSTVMSEFIQYKIGYKDGNKSRGMCAHVMDKCQDFTYNNKKYNPANTLITEYLQRTLTKIKTEQDRILADYGESCAADVESCLVANTFDIDHKNTHNVAVNACRAHIITCMSVTGQTDAVPTPSTMIDWVIGIMAHTSNNDNNTGDSETKPGNITCSRLGEKANATGTACECDTANHWTGLVGYCQCEAGYVQSGTTCVLDTSRQDACIQSGGTWNNNACVCSTTGTVVSNNVCVCDSANNYTGTPPNCALSVPPADGVSPAQKACEFSGGVWSGGACVCSATGLVIDDNVCECDTANGYSGVAPNCTKTNEAVCTTGGGKWNAYTQTCSCAGNMYEWSGTACVCGPAYDTTADGTCTYNPQKACAISGGTWDTTYNTCQCSGDKPLSDGEQCYAVPDEDKDAYNRCIAADNAFWEMGSGCACYNAIKLKLEWDDSQSKCVCIDGYVMDSNGTCVASAAEACKDDGGTWIDGTCECPENETWNGTDECQTDMEICRSYTAGKCPTAKGCVLTTNKYGTSICIDSASYTLTCEQSGGRYTTSDEMVTCDCSAVDLDKDGIYDSVYLDNETGECVQYTFEQMCNNGASGVLSSGGEYTDTGLGQCYVRNLYPSSPFGSYYVTAWRLDNTDAAKQMCLSQGGVQYTYSTDSYGLYNYYNMNLCGCVGDWDLYSSSERDENGNCACRNTTFIRNPDNPWECICPAGEHVRRADIGYIDDIIARDYPSLSLETLRNEYEGTDKLPIYMYNSKDERILDKDGNPIDTKCILGEYTNANGNHSSWYCQVGCGTYEVDKLACEGTGGRWDDTQSTCTCDSSPGMRTVDWLGILQCACSVGKGSFDYDTNTCKCDDGYEMWVFSDGSAQCVPYGSYCDDTTKACKCDTTKSFWFYNGSDLYFDDDDYAWSISGGPSYSFTCRCSSGTMGAGSDGKMACIANPYSEEAKTYCESTGGVYEARVHNSYECYCYSNTRQLISDGKGGCQCLDSRAIYNETTKACDSCQDGYVYWDGRWLEQDGSTVSTNMSCDTEPYVKTLCANSGGTWDDSINNCVCTGDQLVLASELLGTSSDEDLYKICLRRDAYACTQSGQKWICSTDYCDDYGNVDNCSVDQCISADAPTSTGYLGAPSCIR